MIIIITNISDRYYKANVIYLQKFNCAECGVKFQQNNHKNFLSQNNTLSPKENIIKCDNLFTKKTNS